MKKKPINCVFFCFFSLVSFLHAENFDRELLVDKEWKCKAIINIEDSNFYSTTMTNIKFNNDGKMISNGEIKLKMLNLFPEEITYTFNASGNWKIENDDLVQTHVNTAIKNISHPEFDKVFDYNKAIPQNTSSIINIIELTKDKFITGNEALGMFNTCE